MELNATPMKKLLLSALVCFSLLFSSTLANATAISVTAANFKPSSAAVYLGGKNLAAVAITAGQAVWIDTSLALASGQVKLASATGSGNATQVVGIAANGAGVGQPVKIVVRDPQLTVGGAVTAGAIVLLHTTAGAITLTAGDITSGGYVAVLGVGINTTQINFGATKSGSNYLGVVRADVAIP